MESAEIRRWEGYVDWRKRAAVRGRHGGMIAASFDLVAEILEHLAFSANASNLVMYLSRYMHFSMSKSANNVTNFMGTAFLLALLGGFLSDAFFTSYLIFLISAAIQLLGWAILLIQVKMPSLKPPPCDQQANPAVVCQEASGGKAAMLFTGLYLVALGVGGIKGSLPSHGAEQFDDSTPQGRKMRSTFFNYFVFCLSCGGLIAVTLVVWVEDNKGWEWGFGIAMLSIFLSMVVFFAGSPLYRNKIPTGSPLTTISKVLVAAMFGCCVRPSSRNSIASIAMSPAPDGKEAKQNEEGRDSTDVVDEPSKSLKFLNNAVVKKPFHSALECTVKEVEEVKIVLKILPIFGCTIILNCCVAQLSTFSVEQASTMNTKIGSFKVPPASLPIFPILFIMLLAPIYDHVIIPFARRITKTEMGISQLQRIGVGLIFSIGAMAVAAVVETKRKRVATEHGLVDSGQPLPITFLWIAIQYLFLGSADLLSLAGSLEFFFTEAPASMRSLATSLSWASMAMGFYLSSVVVSIVNNVTGNSNHHPWLSGKNINHYHLERFYWLMCVLSGLNFVHYLFWAIQYKYRPKSQQ
ncbi:protein NRT1/ PTR FAMILY 4.6-like [Cucurbita pepo subsp. pepo]|uniref:protein NRT1/ PTR FAMILY 4.6-like n=1 Tax=Cucurbita pepo subsp. pepo TaxID=3664 RepID=UPI000C9D9CA4|nr:protein NRT1/ PTR FAMILY 4.6-like [Cucurbita pepo subsp. pepo]